MEDALRCLGDEEVRDFPEEVDLFLPEEEDLALPRVFGGTFARFGDE